MDGNILEMRLLDYVSTVETYLINGNVELFILEKLKSSKSRKSFYNRIIKTLNDQAKCIKVFEKYGLKKEVSKEIIAVFNGKNKNIEILSDSIINNFTNSRSKNVMLFSYILYALFLQGKFVIANQIQIQVIKRISEKNVKNVPLLWKLWGTYFNNDLENADILYNRMRRQIRTNENRKKLDILYYILFKKKVIRPEKEISMFENLIVNQRIAIIGPSANELDLKKIYGNSDTVIFITYRNKDVYPTIQSQNLKFISYYNNEAIKKLVGEQEKGIENLDYICLKQNKKLEFCNVPIRKAYILDGMYFNGIPHMLPNILFDIIQYAPKSIRTYGFDLYMSEKPYRKNYSNVNKAKEEWIADFAIHNIAIQYIMLDALYKGCYFEPDYYLENILRRGVDEYLKRMEELYVNRSY